MRAGHEKRTEHAAIRRIAVATIAMLLASAFATAPADARTEPASDTERAELTSETVTIGGDEMIRSTNATPVGAYPGPAEATAPTRSNEVTLITDSVVLGAVTRLGNKLPDFNYTSYGFPGFHLSAIDDVLRTIPHRLDGTVILAVGNNDTGFNTTTMRRYVAEVMAILADTPKVIWVRQRVWNTGMARFNQVLTEAFARYPNLEIAEWAAAAAGHPEYIEGDNIHLTWRGWEAVAVLLEAHVRNGIAVNRPVVGHIDVARSTPTGVILAGWAADLDRFDPIDIQVTLNGQVLTTSPAAIPRPDVAAAVHRGPNHGYSLRITSVEDGVHTFCVRGYDALSDSWTELACRWIAVQHQPRAAFNLIERIGNRVRVAGWAFDPDHPNNPVRVRLYADGELIAGPLATRRRRDVAAVHGVGENHGFRFTRRIPPDATEFCVRAIDINRNVDTEIGCRTLPRN